MSFIVELWRCIPFCAAGLVSRTVTAGAPPRVDYALTDLGDSLSEPIDALGGWAVANEHNVEAAREAFDARVKEPSAPSE